MLQSPLLMTWSRMLNGECSKPIQIAPQCMQHACRSSLGMLSILMRSKVGMISQRSTVQLQVNQEVRFLQNFLSHTQQSRPDCRHGRFEGGVLHLACIKGGVDALVLHEFRLVTNVFALCVHVSKSI
jgi:hypothetical protein